MHSITLFVTKLKANLQIVGVENFCDPSTYSAILIRLGKKCFAAR